MGAAPTQPTVAPAQQRAYGRAVNGAHLHLAINHAPLFWLAASMLLLLVALGRRDQSLGRAALVGYVLTGAASVAVLMTGDPAAHTLHGVPGVERALIHRHEELADWATAITGIAGALALLALWRFRDVGLPRWAALALVLLAAAGFVLMAWTCERGGEIRHPEVRSGWTPPPPAPAQAPPH